MELVEAYLLCAGLIFFFFGFSLVAASCTYLHRRIGVLILSPPVAALVAGTCGPEELHVAGQPRAE